MFEASLCSVSNPPSPSTPFTTSRLLYNSSGVSVVNEPPVLSSFRLFNFCDPDVKPVGPASPLDPVTIRFEAGELVMVPLPVMPASDKVFTLMTS